MNERTYERTIGRTQVQQLYTPRHKCRGYKTSLKSDFIQFFHDLIHVYSPWAGGIKPPGNKVLMSTENPYHFTPLLQV